MKKMTHAVALLAVSLVATAAGAQAPPPPHPHGAGGPAYQTHYDGRYSHNVAYPVHGTSVTSLPPQRVVVGRPGAYPYYYSGGVWYRPAGASFVVVAAPYGAFVPILPAYYTTVWMGGVPYYYANDTYYTWSAAQNSYEVVPPPGEGASTQPPPSDDLFIYPQNGQSAEQQSTDKYECHQWAVGQSGFDPTRSGGGVAPEAATAARDNYQRAMRACLEGRGYSVR